MLENETELAFLLLDIHAVCSIHSTDHRSAHALPEEGLHSELAQQMDVCWTGVRNVAGTRGCRALSGVEEDMLMLLAGLIALLGQRHRL
jgi:hypothetical protein